MDRITTTVICLLSLAALSCEEPATPSGVYGTVECSTCSQTFTVNGDLSEGDSKYYGYCEVDGDKNLKFVVGTDDKSHATASSDFYFQLTGVEGPPTEGVYASTTPLLTKDGPSTDFDQGFIKNVNEFAFSQGDAGDQDLCMVELYAVPIEGEVDPNQASFDYYMRLNCRTLGIPSTSGATLNWVRAELWFDNCG
jgi:hypothetical protein